MTKQFIKTYHLFLIAIYPVLNLLDANIGQVTWTVAIRPIVLVLILTSILLIVLAFMIEEIQSFPGNPIIILQGDHGIPGSKRIHRMSILNAYYLPDGGEQLLYNSISPVNTFRLILRHYFNEDIELIEDVASFSTYTNPYRYYMVEASKP